MSRAWRRVGAVMAGAVLVVARVSRLHLRAVACPVRPLALPMRVLVTSGVRVRPVRRPVGRPGPRLAHVITGCLWSGRASMVARPRVARRPLLARVAAGLLVGPVGAGPGLGGLVRGQEVRRVEELLILWRHGRVGPPEQDRIYPYRSRQK
jgi:hypothetical protein